MQGRLCIADHAIGVIANQAAGKRWEALDARRLVLCHECAEDVVGLIRGNAFAASVGVFRGDNVVFAYNMNERIVSKERVPSPALAALYAFQQTVPVGHLRNLAQKRNRRGDIGVNFAAQRNHRIVRGIRLNFGRSRFQHDISSFLNGCGEGRAIKKAFIPSSASLLESLGQKLSASAVPPILPMVRKNIDHSSHTNMCAPR